VFDASTANPVNSISAAGLQTVTWSPDNKLLAAGETNQVQLFNAASGSNVYNHQGQSGNIIALACSPDSKRIASGSSNASVQVWQTQ
jgi:WD40 repeat protein